MKKTDIHWNLEDDISVHPLIRKILFEVKKKIENFFVIGLIIFLKNI